MERIIVTQEKVEKLLAKIAQHKQKPGPLMPALHDAQHIFGCVPVEVQKIISRELNESISKINGVVTFYSQFSLEPKGDHIIGVCLGTACYVRGSQQIIDAIAQEAGIKPGETSADGKFTLEATRCIGACGLAPIFTVVTNGETDVYGNISADESRKVVDKYKNL